MKWLDNLEGLFSSRFIKVLFIVWCACILFIFGTGAYVLVHFISKWW